MINRVVLTGRITKNLGIERTQSNRKYTRFTLAVNRRNSNEQNQQADFINCIAWNKTAETMYQYLSKGSLIGIEGRLNTGSYEKNGQTIYTTDVIVESFTFLEARKDSSYNEPTQEPNQQDYVDLAGTEDYF
jgi:single-strand DNA-binding protein